MAPLVSKAPWCWNRIITFRYFISRPQN